MGRSGLILYQVTVSVIHTAMAQPVQQEDYEKLGESTKHAYHDGSILPELIQKYQRLVDTASGYLPGVMGKVGTPSINV